MVATLPAARAVDTAGSGRDRLVMDLSGWLPLVVTLG